MHFGDLDTKYYFINYFTDFLLLPKHVRFGFHRKIIICLIILVLNYNTEIIFFTFKTLHNNYVLLFTDMTTMLQFQ